MTSRPICFVDTETTGLSHLARPWEIAIVKRYAVTEDGDRPADTEHVWHVAYTPETLPAGTTPEALEVGRWAARGHFPAWLFDTYPDSVQVARGAEWTIARHVHRQLDGAILVGVGVHFDAAILSAMFRRHGLPEQPWHYSIIELKSAGWGAVRDTLALHEDDETLQAAAALPMNSERLAAACDVEPPTDDERHTALGDARWAARWFDALGGAT